MADHVEVRVSDRDRDDYAASLRGGYAEGRITESEFEDRLSKAYAATTRSQLDPLVADLPVKEPKSTARPVSSALSQYVLWFFPALLSTAIWAITNFGGYFWPIWVFLGLGLSGGIPVLFKRSK